MSETALTFAPFAPQDGQGQQNTPWQPWTPSPGPGWVWDGYMWRPPGSGATPAPPERNPDQGPNGTSDPNNAKIESIFTPLIEWLDTIDAEIKKGILGIGLYIFLAGGVIALIWPEAPQVAAKAIGKAGEAAGA